MSIAIIGMGAAGGNIAEAFSYEQGFTTGTINFSEGDLNSLTNIDYKLRLPGSDGMGKNRNNAKPFIKKHHEMITSFIKQNFSNESIDSIMFPFSTGGGSGSGMATMIIDIINNVLRNKIIVAMPILPDLSEPLPNQMNTLELFQELTQEVCILPIDNEQGKGQNIPQRKLHQYVNNQVVQSITNLLNYTQKDSAISNFDHKDLISVLQTKGFATISTTDISKFDQLENIKIGQNNFHQKIIQSWNETVYTPIEHQQIVRAAFLYEGQEKLLDYLDVSNLFSIFKNEPLDTFTGIFENSGGKVTILLTGLSPIQSRLDGIEQLIQEKGSKFNQLYTEPVKHTPQRSNYSFLDKVNKPKKETKNVMDILNQYK
jgi:cell division GTPase FtsZ